MSRTLAAIAAFFMTALTVLFKYLPERMDVLDAE